MQARMNNPVLILPEALQALHALNKSTEDKGVPFVYLGVEDHPDYHQPGDTFEHIDRRFYLGVVDMVLDLVSALDAADAATLRRKAGG